jgi:hypothetical protein
MTSPSPIRLSLDPKLRLNYWLDIIFNPDYSQAEVLKMVLTREKTLPSWVDAGVDFDSEGLIKREGRGRKSRFPLRRRKTSRLNLITCKFPSKVGL